MQTSLVLAIALALSIAGCASSGGAPADLRSPNAKWVNATEVDGLDRQGLMTWWAAFSDPELSDLIGQAYLRNPNMRIAAERVRESRANASVAASALWPTLNANGSAARTKDLSRIPAKPPILDITQVGLSSSWELDLFGGNHAGAESAERSFLAVRELDRAAYIALAAEVASTLFTQRSLVAQLRTQREAVAVSQEVWRFALERYRRGLATQFDVDRSWSLTKTLEAQTLELEREIKGTSHRLAVLTGRMPSAAASSAIALPESLPPVPGLIPSEWLDARPDLQAARHRVEAANASAAQSKAAFFPSFLLSASLARDRLAFQGLPPLSGNVFALGVGLVQPIFNAGRIRAFAEGADARLQQAAAGYDEALLEAVEEVENAFVAYSTAGARQEQLNEARRAALRARNSARALYERGLTDYSVYLDAQRVHLAAEQSYIDITARRAIALVALYRAFGGGIAADTHRIASADK